MKQLRNKNIFIKLFDLNILSLTKPPQISSGIDAGSGPQFQTVYCDFEEHLGSSNLETDFAPPLMFEALRSFGDLDTHQVAITFDSFNFNTFGSAMDLETGIFTAPRDGTYQFKGLTT